jgi:hypothetical protein
MCLAKEVRTNLATTMSLASSNSTSSWKVIIVKNMVQMTSTARSDRKMQENHLLSQLHRSDKVQGTVKKILIQNTNKIRLMIVLTDLVK